MLNSVFMMCCILGTMIDYNLHVVHARRVKWEVKNGELLFSED